MILGSIIHNNMYIFSYIIIISLPYTIYAYITIEVSTTFHCELTPCPELLETMLQPVGYTMPPIQTLVMLGTYNCNARLRRLVVPRPSTTPGWVCSSSNAQGNGSLPTRENVKLLVISCLIEWVVSYKIVRICQIIRTDVLFVVGTTRQLLAHEGPSLPMIRKACAYISFKTYNIHITIRDPTKNNSSRITSLLHFISCCGCLRP